MKNNNHLKLKIIILALVTSMIFSACSSDNIQTTELEIKETTITNETEAVVETTQEDAVEKDLSEETSIVGNPTDQPESSPNENNDLVHTNYNLTDDEIAGLIFMREEEKLAKDVYLGLYELWGLSIFQNIASSEQTHTDAVKNLLDLFEIEDPADTSPPGTFTNVALQELYDELMKTGAQSLGNALLVGGAIEEIDILDLQEYLETTQNEEIRRVYENLLRGSENHLRAFTSNYKRQTGETYMPQYLNQLVYDKIGSNRLPRGGRGNGNRP